MHLGGEPDPLALDLGLVDLLAQAAAAMPMASWSPSSASPRSSRGRARAAATRPEHHAGGRPSPVISSARQLLAAGRKELSTSQLACSRKTTGRPPATAACVLVEHELIAQLGLRARRTAAQLPPQDRAAIGRGDVERRSVELQSRADLGEGMLEQLAERARASERAGHPTEVLNAMPICADSRPDVPLAHLVCACASTRAMVSL